MVQSQVKSHHQEGEAEFSGAREPCSSPGSGAGTVSKSFRVSKSSVPFAHYSSIPMSPGCLGGGGAKPAEG